MSSRATGLIVKDRKRGRPTGGGSGGSGGNDDGSPWATPAHPAVPGGQSHRIFGTFKRARRGDVGYGHGFGGSTSTPAVFRDGAGPQHVPVTANRPFGDVSTGAKPVAVWPPPGSARSPPSASPLSDENDPFAVMVPFGVGMGAGKGAGAGAGARAARGPCAVTGVRGGPTPPAPASRPPLQQQACANCRAIASLAGVGAPARSLCNHRGASRTASPTSSQDLAHRLKQVELEGAFSQPQPSAFGGSWSASAPAHAHAPGAGPVPAWQASSTSAALTGGVSNPTAASSEWPSGPPSPGLDESDDEDSIMSGGGAASQPRSVRVQVRLQTGTTFFMDVDASTTAQDVSRYVDFLHGCAPARQRIIVGGRQVQPTSPVAPLVEAPAACIFVMMRS